MRTPPANRPPDSIWFKLLIPLGFVFCATALSWVMTAFDRSGAPIVRWINQYAVWAIVLESLAIVAVAVVAMAVDRKQSLQNRTARPENEVPGRAVISDEQTGSA